MRRESDGQGAGEGRSGESVLGMKGLGRGNGKKMKPYLVKKCVCIYLIVGYSS